MAKVLERRGDHPGLVHIISAMEACRHCNRDADADSAVSGERLSQAANRLQL